MARRITDAYPGLLPGAPVTSISPEAIEKQSMQVIESLLPKGLAGYERTVAKRIIHASGDPTIAHLIKFSPSAIKSGTDAISAGSPIYTDVKMAASGINRKLADSCGCRVSCALDEVGDSPVTSESVTRSASAMRALGSRLNNAVVAIGNAPTALLALSDMIKKAEVAPALVIGMPVGFVMARESKIELMKHGTPFITIVGTRGGSALAAATVNALLRLIGK